jgi:hypothetical protein
MRTDWAELPEEFRNGIEDATGPIDDIEPAATGNHADIASMLDTPNGRTFVKAARRMSPEQDGPEARSLRGESVINPYVSPPMTLRPGRCTWRSRPSSGRPIAGWPGPPGSRSQVRARAGRTNRDNPTS